MRKALHRKPSASLVIAIIALCVAASGTAIAATKLVKGDKLIAKHSLSGNRLRNHTITGKQISLGKLGTVPSATNASNATNAGHATSADTASSATNATHAGNADTVGGLPASAFVPASKFVASNGLIKMAGTPTGNTRTIISSSPLSVTVTCTKSAGNVTLSMDTHSSEANSVLEGTQGTSLNVEHLGPVSTFADDWNTNIDMAAPSGATLDFVESVGINSLGTDCWVHFFGVHS